MANDANTSPDFAAASHLADGLDHTALVESGEALSQMRDRWLRAQADRANVRSRAQRSPRMALAHNPTPG